MTHKNNMRIVDMERQSYFREGNQKKELKEKLKDADNEIKLKKFIE